MSRALAVCLVAALAVLPLAPVEHVHQAEAADGHHQTVAHAHFDDHHHSAVADDHRPATHVEDDDSAVVTLDRLFVTQSVHHLELAVAAGHHLSPPAVVRAGVAARYQRRFIHGPPRAPTALRAPPTTPSV